MNLYIRISENQKTLSNTERWNSYDKKMILKKCWISLMSNTSSEDCINIYHHNVKDATLIWLSENCPILHNFIETSSITENFVKPLEDIQEYIIDEKDESKIIGYIEDDYLWNINSLKIIKEAFEYWRGFILPQDSPKNYKIHAKTHVFVGQDRHWKSNIYISWNLFGTVHIFKRYLNEIKESANSQDIQLLQNLLQKTEFINPIPGVASHCKDDDMTPLVNWNYIWNGITI